MDSATYDVESRVEMSHWWFVGRRWLFRGLIRRMGIPSDAAILDVGTSTGTNLRMLTGMGFTGVQGMDLEEAAILWCAEKGLGTVRQGDVCAMPFAEADFDLVLATDIVEHVDDDVLALREIYRVLKPSGRALLTVPVFRSLWGLQDQVSHHKRRYRRKEFVAKLCAAGFTVENSFYFNFLLFAPIWLARQVITLLRLNLKSENELNPPLINAILGAVFALDVRLAPRIRPPFGVSICVIVRKP